MTSFIIIMLCLKNNSNKASLKLEGEGPFPNEETLSAFIWEWGMPLGDTTDKFLL